ncbi:MAG: hypothetical protein K8L97_30630 [Anaerolineae bacterium]|nr:hypothetical protein [Anaerolineae bacterium]
MSTEKRFRAIAATTHIDRHQERFTREALEELAQVYISRGNTLIFWNHETTLPPIGVVKSAHVENREDGEYELIIEGVEFDSSDFVSINQNPINGFIVSDEQLVELLKIFPPAIGASNHIHIAFDEQNFKKDEIETILQEIDTFLPISVESYVRKNTDPHPVIWIILGSGAGAILNGFLSRYGEVAADKTISVVKGLYQKLSGEFRNLAEKSEEKQSDFLVSFELPNSDTKIECAIESTEDQDIENALINLWKAELMAFNLIDKNRKDLFSCIKFLFNSKTGAWELNYLVSRAHQQITWGPRYNPNHPNYERYEEMLKSIEENRDVKWGMSIGGLPRIGDKYDGLKKKNE